ncbi:TPA: ADP-ribosylglycohydrolase family protein [Stenotrophomonas maltophilia]|nr:ADP-ribosylglycohydrolase family protein [Stenotrophomonas maltophilia]HDS1154648.1 ADP-ribosylglycohydrolase family protein [Stenotrophomonas maltophilia]HDS1167505.1 ADP-ribosylglycohydrolase family protein [Stenotrophomonas maltophilia]HDS1170651.1 ADP-ribosylglycohydrolase family protein [Stenotrophomonas maltophilia]HDS1177315.1 ADP-ribosylglycohydrolase family protein [Stenotrophomonas maltophilia]
MTHGALEVSECCKLFGAQLHLALSGADKEEALTPRARPLLPRALIIGAGEYKHKSREQIRSSGYVVDTLEAAQWAVWNTDNFRDAILLATNLADDTDRVAATSGQIAGALHGASGVPPEWVAKVAWSQHICDLVGRVFALAPAGDELDEFACDLQ